MNCCIILARANSKRVPGKHLRDLSGHPLLYYTATQAKRALGSVYLSSDSQEILDYGSSLGLIPILRPESLAQDDTSSFETLKHALSEIKQEITNIVLINSCCPFTTEHHIRQIVILHELQKNDITVSVVESPESHPAKIFVEGGNFDNWKENKEYGLMKKVWRRNAALYVMKKEVLLGSNFYEGKIGLYEMPKLCSYDINNEEDMFLCELIMRNTV